MLKKINYKKKEKMLRITKNKKSLARERAKKY